MNSRPNALLSFIAPLQSQITEIYDWPAARFEVSTYLHPIAPPEEFITSVRALVVRGPEVLLVRDPDGHHILPGGRREAGESFVETAKREVLEETGWQVEIGTLLGFKYFRRLTPKPPEIQAPAGDFAQLIYAATPIAYQAEAKEQGGYELGAEFVAIEMVDHALILESERLLLQAALDVV